MFSHALLALLAYGATFAVATGYAVFAQDFHGGLECFNPLYNLPAALAVLLACLLHPLGILCVFYAAWVFWALLFSDHPWPLLLGGLYCLHMPASHLVFGFSWGDFSEPSAWFAYAVWLFALGLTGWFAAAAISQRRRVARDCAGVLRIDPPGDVRD